MAAPADSLKVVLGTMTFGGQVDEAGSAAFLDAFAAAGHVELDTAVMYCDGGTERVLGALSAATDGRFKVASKAGPWWDGSSCAKVRQDAGLSKERVLQQVDISLERMKADKMDLLYLHAPDHRTDIGETLEGVVEAYAAGKFERFGLSNYSAWQVADIVHRLRAMDTELTVSVYQGMYNAVTRDIERELLPCLREFGIAFYAYNPLAGGLLTGKYSLEDAPETGRFNTTTLWGAAYRQRYWNDTLFGALDAVKEELADSATPTEAAFRWLVHHSKLDASLGDAVILGASKMSHLESNLAALSGGELSEEVCKHFDAAWEVQQSKSPSYFR
eukprot:PLAT15968.1.p2 GENE.PLAT15968.1~~PLAT15968.1.p2  ORF type:complete len:347 (+),score=162.40 PLAT15968.1:49-1041(+)